MDFQALSILQKPEQNRIHGSVPALLSIIFSFHVCSDLCSEPVSCVGNKFAPPVRVKYLSSYLALKVRYERWYPVLAVPVLLIYINFKDFIAFLRLWPELGREELLNVEGIAGVCVGQVLVVGVLCDVVLVREKGPDAAKLQDALAAVHDGNFILAHQLFATLSSEEFILFAFSYTESCRCSINVLN